MRSIWSYFTLYLVAVALVALAIAGCGSSSSPKRPVAQATYLRALHAPAVHPQLLILAPRADAKLQVVKTDLAAVELDLVTAKQQLAAITAPSVAPFKAAFQANVSTFQKHLDQVSADLNAIQ